MKKMVYGCGGRRASRGNGHERRRDRLLGRALVRMWSERQLVVAGVRGATLPLQIAQRWGFERHLLRYSSLLIMSGGEFRSETECGQSDLAHCCRWSFWEHRDGSRETCPNPCQSEACQVPRICAALERQDLEGPGRAIDSVGGFERACW